MNVIKSQFDPPFLNGVFVMIKFGGGMDAAEKVLLAEGYHPSFVKAVIKKVIRERGW